MEREKQAGLEYGGMMLFEPLILSETANKKVTFIKIVRNCQAQVTYKALLGVKSLLAPSLNRWETDSKGCPRVLTVLT